MHMHMHMHMHMYMHMQRTLRAALVQGNARATRTPRARARPLTAHVRAARVVCTL